MSLTVYSSEGSKMKVKGLSSKEFVVCNDLVLALPHRITAISDGAAATPKQSGGWGGLGSRAEIKFDLGYKDQGLEVISESFDTSKNMVSDMNEIDKATSDLKNTKVRLKGTIYQVN
ncbi:hypothetical protein MTR67_002031 [Solanum verrucosum]|uniref:Uncharacterized protein n=1 Tax=Solanum verrucosum TaxID=315347 RepID=A0AAF0T812_SOLVR|nr:hypothetical protein MTR67_002031 [Solanum verrucosum]